MRNIDGRPLIDTSMIFICLLHLLCNLIIAIIIAIFVDDEARRELWFFEIHLRIGNFLCNCSHFVWEPFSALIECLLVAIYVDAYSISWWNIFNICMISSPNSYRNWKTTNKKTKIAIISFFFVIFGVYSSILIISFFL